MKRQPLAIIGYGMVGQAVGAHFPRAAKYDPKSYAGGWSDVDAAEIIFLCVPTPYRARTGYDMRAIESTAKKLSGRKIIVLKSTVMPGTTAILQKKYPNHIWLFNPEFLRDKTATKDFLHPDRQIVGWAKATPAHRRAAQRVMRLLPRAPYQALTSSTEAELVKMFANAFLATKVVFANMIYDVAKQLGADYDQVRLGVGHDPRITLSMMQVGLDGYRGYSGKCFPKDMGALIWWGKHNGRRLPLLETADAINWRLLPRRQRKR